MNFAPTLHHPDQIGQPREMVFRLAIPYLSFWEIEGSRRQLEAEGAIPAGLEWPSRDNDAVWLAGPLEYRLRRCRPAGIRGPMAVWITGDWWCLRCTDRTADPDQQRLRALEMAVMEERHRLTERGKLEWERLWRAAMTAFQDDGYQRFRARVPALSMPRRGRKGV